MVHVDCVWVWLRDATSTKRSQPCRIGCPENFRDCNEPRYALEAFDKERFGKLDLMNEKNVLQKLGCTAWHVLHQGTDFPGKLIWNQD